MAFEDSDPCYQLLSDGVIITIKGGYYGWPLIKMVRSFWITSRYLNITYIAYKPLHWIIKNKEVFIVHATDLLALLLQNE